MGDVVGGVQPEATAGTDLLRPVPWRSTNNVRSAMKTKWVLVLVCWSLLAIHCDDGGACKGYESDYEALVAGAKSCSLDADCQVLHVNCGMMYRQAEYVNLTLDLEDLDSLTFAWGDQGCGGWVGHMFCDGLAPPEAVCVQGQCGPGSRVCEDVFACDVNSDCVKVASSCCPCTMGGGSTAINANCIDEYSDPRGCAPAMRFCDDSIVCNDLVATCEDGQCALVEDGGDDQ